AREHGSRESTGPAGRWGRSLDIMAEMIRRRRLLRPSTGLWVAALAAVLFLWVTSYYRYRLFSQQGRLLLLVVKGDAQTDYWLRVKPPTAGDWRALRPTGSLRVAG